MGEAACGEVERLRKAGDGAALRGYVTSALAPAFGSIVENSLRECWAKSWAADPLTFAAGATERAYGHPLLKRPLPWGVHFAGTETESENGHVEGAVQAGERAAEEVAQSIKMGYPS